MDINILLQTATKYHLSIIDFKHLIKKYNADMFHLIPDDYREFQIKEYIKDQ